jgi:hypothetical protein
LKFIHISEILKPEKKFENDRPSAGPGFGPAAKASWPAHVVAPRGHAHAWWRGQCDSPAASRVTRSSPPGPGNCGEMTGQGGSGGNSSERCGTGEGGDGGFGGGV